MKQILSASRGQTAGARPTRMFTASMSAENSMHVAELPPLNNSIIPETASMSQGKAILEKEPLEMENGAMQTWEILLGKGTSQTPGPDDWMKTIGAFEDNPRMQEISAEGRRIRKSERDY